MQAELSRLKRLFILLLILSLLPGMGWAESVTDRSYSSLGNAVTGRAVTATLYVSPNGDNSTGSTWSTAYTTIQDAITASSSDAEDLTMIMVGPGTYDINTTGDPTYTNNVCIVGSHRNFAKIKNDHASATSVMKFTGLVCLQDVTIDCGSGTNDGVIISGSGTKGARVTKVYFECENVTGAQTALEISGGTEYTRLQDVKFHGVLANTKGLLLDDVKFSDIWDIQFHDCLTGIQITNADSDQNVFDNLLFHENTLGLDLDAGNTQIFENIHFFKNTTRVDDEVGDHSWNDINGSFPISTEPDNFSGVNVPTGDGADTWGASTEIRAAATSTVPFTIVGLNLEADASEKYRIRLSSDGGSTWFDDLQFEGVATGINTKGFSFPGGTEFIFNKGTQIVAQLKSESAGIDNCLVWLKIQEI